ncbi:MAG: ATP-binding cassette domain-containing protein [Candidatus Paracaedibacteraceae bacterium]|nr:ATP-binding cassette domain-containing protein [Candidatus Paracaedibacteraceae bacterium]
MFLKVLNADLEKSFLNIQDLQHPYIAMTQIKPLSINIKPCECLWVKGDNGSGKSTFLKLISGILPATFGHIELFAKITYLGPELGMKMDATHADYQQFIMKLGAKCTSELSKKRELNSFSSGQKLNIRLQAALRSDRPLWILDEPTRFLDSKSEAVLWGRIRQHCDGGGAAVIASHAPVTPLIPGCKLLQF